MRNLQDKKGNTITERIVKPLLAQRSIGSYTFYNYDLLTLRLVTFVRSNFTQIRVNLRSFFVFNLSRYFRSRVRRILLIS